VVTCVRAAFAAVEIPFVGSRAVLQGFGKVGGTLAFLLSSAGMRMIGISDAGGAVYNPGGVDPLALSDHVSMTGSVAGFTGAEPIDEADMWALESEVAVPAALSCSLTEEMASRLGAPRGADTPT